MSSGNAGGRLSESISYEQVIREAISEYLKAQLAKHTQSPCLAADVWALQDHRAITCPSLKPVQSLAAAQGGTTGASRQAWCEPTQAHLVAEDNFCTKY